MSQGVGDYASEAEGAYGPVLRDPCIPIVWHLSTVGVPAGAEHLAQGAVASVAAYTGLVFVFDGYTDEHATFDGPILVHEDGWNYAPMVIGWGTDAVSTDLGGDTTGVGGARVTPGTFWILRRR